ncbi:YhdP family protein [Thiolapillus brandeum]|uniref:YhdP central domain-containing protein n=1 Tax=Thiolapillus brandeum TaxID=1076588 RepID=A0A7U6JGU3_9GAMM|nr:YhdP family protein [Thiolapillus brandeum]BAO43133.1 hypothetical protein TBH_C0185 [Thiolapillus brandeum]
MFWSIFRGFGTFVTRLLYLIIIIGAVAKVLTFSFALYAESHKDVIESLASRFVGTPVRFARIQTYWAGVTPRIWVRQLTLGEKEQLTLGDTLVGLNLRALPRWRKNLPLNIRLEGTRIQVLRDARGKTRILGVLQHQQGINLPAYIHLADATLDWVDEKRHTGIHQEHLSVQLVTRGKHSSLRIASAREGFQVRGEINGSITGSDWSGQFWSRGDALKSEKFLQAYLPDGYFLSNLQLSYQLWSYWKAGAHTATRILFDMDAVELHAPDGGALALSALQGDLFYRKQKQDWTLQLDKLQLRINDQSLEETRMALQERDGRFHLGISRIDLATISPLLALLPDDHPVKPLLRSLAPKGELTDLHASTSNPLFAGLRVHGRFDGVSLQPWKKLPGLSNFSGRLTLDDKRLLLDLDTTKAKITFNTLFREALDIERLQGRLQWKRQADGAWIIQGDQLFLDTPDLQTISRLKVEHTPGQPPILDMQTDFHHGIGRNAGRYYPVGIMKSNLVKWLDESIVSGQVNQGSFLFYGPLAKGHFPFHKTHDGHFEITFDVDKLELAYRKEWPPLRQVQGRVRFHNNDLSIHANRGRIYNSRISHAKAVIRSLKPLAPIQVSGSVAGPGNDPLRLLRDSPLRQTFASRIQGMALDGNIKLRMDLDIPLHHSRSKKKPQVAFSTLVNFKGNKLILQQQQLVLQDIKGQLKINNSGLHAKNLQSTALSGPLSIDIAPNKLGTGITARGNLPAEGIVAQYPWLQPLSLSGRTGLDITLDIPGLNHPDRNSILQISSSLQGMAVNLPEPLGKKAGSSIPLNINMQLNADSFQHTTLKYGNRINLTLKQDQEKGTDVFLDLSSLPLRPWTAHLGNSRKPPGDISSLHNLVLSIDTLTVPPLKTGKFKLNLKRQGDAWQGEINADSLKGELSFASDITSRPLVLRLQQLAMDTLTDSPADKDQSGNEASPQLQPRNFPSLDITSESVLLNGANLGRLKLHSRLEDDHQAINELELHGKLLDLSAHGNWEPGAHGSITWIKGALTSDNMGKLLKKALHKDLLFGSRTYLSFDLSWPGAPFHPDLEQLQGQAQLDMARGRFLNFKPGLARVLGLINFQSLGRRLKLDFKDVYKEGLAFDTILGNFQFDAGYLYTNNLEVSGPSATILIAGSMDLINETYDQVLSVSPRLDATLPVASAIVGGPAAGVAILLAQQAFSKDLEKAQRITYNISGTWDDPQVTRLRQDEIKEDSPANLLDQ